jgi:hypothetical protein
MLMQVADRLTNWRHSIGNAGFLALQRRVFPNLPPGSISLNTTEVRGEWCTWAVTRTEEDHPFYFADVKLDVDGNVKSLSVCFGFFRKAWVELMQTHRSQGYLSI